MTTPHSLSLSLSLSLPQLLVGDEVVLTFGCSSVSEREEWMKAFDVFRQIALPAPEHPALHTVTSTDGKARGHIGSENVENECPAQLLKRPCGMCQ